MIRVDELRAGREIERDPDMPDPAVRALQALAKPARRHCPCHAPVESYGPTSRVSEPQLFYAYRNAGPAEDES